MGTVWAVKVIKLVRTDDKEGKVCGEDCQFLDRWELKAKCKLFGGVMEENKGKRPLRLEECKEREV